MTGEQDRGGEDRNWQRADLWLWCARFAKTRAECARLIAEGRLRVNRQPTDKAHARIRPGDVLTVAMRDVRVVEVLGLARRRGPAPEARLLFREIAAEPACAPPRSAANTRP